MLIHLPEVPLSEVEAVFYDYYPPLLEIELPTSMRICVEGDLALVIRDGLVSSGNPPLESTLTFPQQRSLQTYLQSCPKTVGAVGRLNHLLTSVLVGPGPGHITQVRRFLVSAVARALQPLSDLGETTLLLQGEAGIGKTQFVKILFGDDGWCEEFDDPSLVFSAPWGVAVCTRNDRQKFPGCVTIPLTTIRLDLLRAWRDEIWGAAYCAFKNGEPWILESDGGSGLPF